MISSSCATVKKKAIIIVEYNINNKSVKQYRSDID
jgi:hypothetical protein